MLSENPHFESGDLPHVLQTDMAFFKTCVPDM